VPSSCPGENAIANPARSSRYSAAAARHRSWQPGVPSAEPYGFRSHLDKRHTNDHATTASRRRSVGTMVDMWTPAAGSHFRLIDFSPAAADMAHPAHAALRWRGLALTAAPRRVFAEDDTEPASGGVEPEMEMEMEVEVDVVTVPTTDEAYPQVHSRPAPASAFPLLPPPPPPLLPPPPCVIRQPALPLSPISLPPPFATLSPSVAPLPSVRNSHRSPSLQTPLPFCSAVHSPLFALRSLCIAFSLLLPRCAFSPECPPSNPHLDQP